MSDDPQTQIRIDQPVYMGMLTGSTVAVPVYDSAVIPPQVGEQVEITGEDGMTYQGQVVLVQYLVRIDCLKEG